MPTKLESSCGNTGNVMNIINYSKRAYAVVLVITRTCRMRAHAGVKRSAYLG